MSDGTAKPHKCPSEMPPFLGGVILAAMIVFIGYVIYSTTRERVPDHISARQMEGCDSLCRYVAGSKAFYLYTDGRCECLNGVVPAQVKP